MLKRLFLSFVLVKIVSSVAISKDFKNCKRNYEETVGNLIVSESYPAASAVWRLLFKSFDVNNNDVIGASEVVVKLETENMASTNDMKELLHEAQSWINQAGGGDREINFDQFVQLISRTLGHVEGIPSSSWVDVAAGVCSYFNSRIPDMITSFKQLISCSNNLKEKQLELMGEPDSQKLILNIWRAVHASLNNLNQSELSKDLCEQYKICDVIETDLAGNDTMGEFYNVVRQILFDDSSERAWLNMTSLSQLKRRMNTCLMLNDVRNKTMTSFQLNKECVSKYNDVTERILGKDVGIAPSFIFTLADKNKDAVMTSQEIELFIGHPIKSQELFKTPMSLSNMTSLLPSHVAVVGETGVELSQLSLQEQLEWNEFCLTSIQTVAQYFPVIDVSTDVNVTEAIEIVLKEFKNPESKYRDEILNFLDLFRDVQTTTSIVTSSAQQSSSVTSPTITVTELTTTTTETTSFLDSSVASLTTTSDDLVNVIRDVITELKNKTNSTSPDIEGDLTDLLGDVRIANNDAIDTPRLSNEELELFGLLSEYEKKDLDGKDFGVKEKGDEEELKELLEREIKKKRN